MTVTDEQVIEFDGVSRRVLGVRYELVDSALSRIGEIHPVEGSDAPSLRSDSGRSVKRTLQTLRIRPDEVGDIDRARDRVRVMVDISNLAPRPFGVYAFGTTPKHQTTAGVSMSASLNDIGFRLAKGIPTALSLGIGAQVFDFLVQFAQDFGYPDPWIDPTSAVVQAPMTWPAATPGTRIMAEVGLLAGFLDPYILNNGRLRQKAAPDLGSLLAPELVYEQGGRILAGSVVTDDSFLDAPNRYIVQGSGTTTSPIVGWFDVPDSAPFSAAAKGYVDPANPTQMQGIADNAAADAAAYALYLRSPAAYQTIEWDSPFDPRHETFDAVQALTAPWMEQSWSWRLAAGQPMHHVGVRVWTP